MVPGREDECRAKVAKITEAYQQSSPYEELLKEISDLRESPRSDAFKTKVRKLGCARATGHLFTEFGMILYRQFKTTLRDPNAFFLRIIIGIMMSVIVGATWYQVDVKDNTSQQNIPGCLFYLSTFVSMRFEA